MKVYLVGSLKDPEFHTVSAAIRGEGHEVYDFWRGAGPTGDASWRDYEQGLGHNYVKAIGLPYAQQAYWFDRDWIAESDLVVAVCKSHRLPGPSSVAELALAKLGMGKPTFVLLSGEPTDWELMLPVVVDEFFYWTADLLNRLRGMDDEPHLRSL